MHTHAESCENKVEIRVIVCKPKNAKDFHLSQPSDRTNPVNTLNFNFPAAQKYMVFKPASLLAFFSPEALAN